MNDTAILSSEGKYTSFKFGGRNIRFMTSPYLEKYVEVKEWDNNRGYVVVTSRYKDGDIEDYIDLFSILENLYIDPEIFLKPIKNVRICYEPKLAEVIEKADFVENGYAFTTVDDYIRILHLDNLDSAAVMNKKGEVIGMTMDDKELGIVKEIFKQKVMNKG